MVSWRTGEKMKEVKIENGMIVTLDTENAKIDILPDTKKNRSRVKVFLEKRMREKDSWFEKLMKKFDAKE